MRRRVGRGLALGCAIVWTIGGGAGTPVATAGVGSGVTITDAAGDASPNEPLVDIKSVSLHHDTIGTEESLKATIRVDGTIAADGSSALPGTGQPSAIRLLVMFNNKDKQTNGDNTNTGCARSPIGRIRDQQPHWTDGAYAFVGIDIGYRASLQWEHEPIVGWYEPDGAYRIVDLESEPKMASRFSVAMASTSGDTEVTIEVASLVRETSMACVGGEFLRDFAAASRPGPYSTSYAGDRIANVFGLSTLESIVAPAPPALRSPGDPISDFGMEPYEAVHTTFTDWTNRSFGGSVVVNPTIPTDTFVKGPTCPTETYGGTYPANQQWLMNQNQACHVDDDVIGSVFTREFRGSGYDFVW